MQLPIELDSAENDWTLSQVQAGGPLALQSFQAAGDAVARQQVAFLAVLVQEIL